MYSTYSDKNYHFTHKHSLIITVLFAFITFFQTYAYAGAESGELFGYKIGDKYPANKNTIVKKRGVSDISFEILTENPIKPKEMQEVIVRTTVQTFTIINIFSRNKFDSIKKASDFEKKYSVILKTKYPQAVSNNNPNKYFSVELNKEYQLTVDYPINLLSHKVVIKLEAIGGLREKLNGLMHKEYNAALLLDASKSEDYTDGL